MPDERYVIDVLVDSPRCNGSMVQTIIHTHVGIAHIKRAYALYRRTLPLGT